jgi:hypothetical protein
MRVEMLSINGMIETMFVGPTVVHVIHIIVNVFAPLPLQPLTQLVKTSVYSLKKTIGSNFQITVHPQSMAVIHAQELFQISIVSLGLLTRS